MKDKLINILKNFSYSLSANFISLLISTFVILIVPKIIGVEEYGYWQLYIFYSSYVGFLHFGWNDGIYLRYGGEEYSNLDKKIFYSQFYSLVILQTIIALILSIGTIFFISDADKTFIFIMIAVQLIIVNSRYMLLFILQSTNRIKDYSITTIIDRTIYLALIVTLILAGVSDYYLLIFADLLGKSLSLFYAMYLCKDIVFKKISNFTNIFDEAIESIKAGIKLMLSNIANTLIIGVVRFGIERNWNVSTFGKVSLSLSVSNMFMIFINALGLVIYPVLRRIGEKYLIQIYYVMRNFLMTFSLGILILYMPIKETLSLWLPNYAESLNYLGLLLPIVIYESKMSLLINTYMKALRLENTMLKFNALTMVISVVFTWINAFWFQNLNLTVLSIVLLISFRGIISEFILSYRLNISIVKDVLLESVMTIIFIYSGWFVNSVWTPIIYGLFYLAYIYIKRKDLKNSIQFITNLLKK